MTRSCHIAQKLGARAKSLKAENSTSDALNDGMIRHVRTHRLCDRALGDAYPPWGGPRSQCPPPGCNPFRLDNAVVEGRKASDDRAELVRVPSPMTGARLVILSPTPRLVSVGGRGARQGCRLMDRDADDRWHVRHDPCGPVAVPTISAIIRNCCKTPTVLAKALKPSRCNSKQLYVFSSVK